MDEGHNMLVEAGRMTRWTIIEKKEVNIEELDGLVIPGGIEDLYTLPILALMLLNLALEINWFHSKNFAN